MNNSSQPNMDQLLSQMQAVKFGAVFSAAFNLLKKNPLVLMGLFFVPMLIAQLIQQYLFGQPASLNSVAFGLMPLLAGVVSALIGLFATGLVLQAAHQTHEGKKVDALALANQVKNRFLDAIRLIIKVFVFTGGWILIAYFAATALLLPISLALSGLLALLTPVAVILYIVFYFPKIIDSSLAATIFWTDDHIRPDAALQKSIDISKNLRMTIFGNYLILGLISMLLSMLLGAPLMLSLLLSAGQMGAAFGSAVISGIFGTFALLFVYSLKLQIEHFRTGDHHHASHAGHDHDHSGHGHQH